LKLFVDHIQKESVKSMEQNRINSSIVLGQMVIAVEMMSKENKVANVLPEIRSNLVMALPGALSVDEVAGIPGRLTAVFGKITAPAYPAFGASHNTARILLALMEHDLSRRAAMEIKNTPALINALRKNGFEPYEIVVKTEKTLKEVFKESNKEGNLPKIFFIDGGVNREGATIVSGDDAVEVAETVIKIAGLSY
jgi:predicted fused transcriptional regulator/phosphomethylpyrimidine kinase